MYSLAAIWPQIVLDWSIAGTADGEHVNLEGAASDVVRRGADGFWRCLIDKNQGTAVRQPACTYMGRGSTLQHALSDRAQRTCVAQAFEMRVPPFFWGFIVDGNLLLAEMLDREVETRTSR
jgi:hypothetical protein